MFKSTRNKGFQMTFKNGITISVQFGFMNYCSRKNEYPYDSTKLEEQDEMRQHIIESNTAEIAIWDKNGTWFDFGDDTVKGHVDTDEVARWIAVCSDVADMDHLRIKALEFELIG